MKTKLCLTFLLSFIFYLLSSQVPPQGFNYQAIARDGSGNPLVDTQLDIKLGIQIDSFLLGETVWEELHIGVVTNSFGLFSIVLGEGSKSGGSAPGFGEIDWTVNPLYIKTQIFYQGEWKNMGISKLWSVPYSMLSRDLAGPVNKFIVQGETPDLEEALFEVRNNTGQIVFAVYNEGVRAYVDDGIGKGVKGGFAIGGFGPDKANSQPLFVVNADSIRAYIDVSPTKAKKGGFAIGGFDKSKGTSYEFLNVASDTTGIINPSQNRVLWYPLKNAFLTGRVLIENKDSVGVNSFSTGYESKAIGNWSQALGYKAKAIGNYSTSIGNQAKAKGKDSYAFGTGAEASGNLSFAMGSVGVDSLNNPTGKTKALGEAAFSLGFGSIASDLGSFAFGVNDSASGLFSLSMGYATRARGVFSTTMGVGNIAESIGWCSTATGFLTKTGNWAATSFGDQTYAKGHTSFATGYKTMASGHLSATFGAETTASGIGAIATGYNTDASGMGSLAMGYATSAPGDGSVAMGLGTSAQAYTSLTIGAYNVASGNPNFWIQTDPVFVIGNGSSESARSNAMTVYKNGVADFGAYINLNKNSNFGALYVNSHQALWYDGTYFSWGYDASYNYFARPVTIGNPGPQTYMLYVQGNTYSSGGYTSSDIRWKKDLQPLGNILPSVLKLNGYHYNWRTDEFPDMNFDNDRQIGLVAQEVEKIFPELVKNDSKGYKAVSYEKLSVLLLEGLKEQENKIEALSQENLELKSDLQSLRDEIMKLKNIIGSE
jgi:hypothetical protein